MMFAVIKTGGKQYRVQKGDILQVERLDTEQGQTVVFDEVLLVQDGKNTLIGTPLVEKAQVKAEIIENFKDAKVVIFKKKRRKQYKKKTGHRQMLTRIKIEEISFREMEPAPKPKVEEKEKEISGKPGVKREAVPKEEAPKKAEVKKKPEVKKKSPAKKQVKPTVKKGEAAKTAPKRQADKAASKPKKMTKTKEK